MSITSCIHLQGISSIQITHSGLLSAPGGGRRLKTEDTLFNEDPDCRLAASIFGRPRVQQKGTMLKHQCKQKRIHKRGLPANTFHVIATFHRSLFQTYSPTVICPRSRILSSPRLRTAGDLYLPKPIFDDKGRL